MTNPDGSEPAPAHPSLSEILQNLPKNKRPPVHLWHPDRVGTIDMQILRDGRWLHEGDEIKRHRMVKLFSTILRLDENQTYYLVTPIEKLAITVDDAPFTAVEMNVIGEGEGQILTFRTNVDEEIALSEAHPLRIVSDPETEEPSPYILVRDNLEALIIRAVFYDLVDLAVEREIKGKLYHGVWSAGVFFPLGLVEEDED